jgi:leucyl aminopeptidase
MNQNKSGPVTSLVGWNMKSWLSQAVSTLDECDVELVYCGADVPKDRCLSFVKETIPAWQSRGVNFDEGELFVLSGQQRPVILMRPKAPTEAQKRDGGLLAPSVYGQARDLVGRAASEARKLKAQKINVRFESCQDREILGALVGLELAAYTYKQAVAAQPAPLPVLGLAVKNELKEEAQALAMGTNVARHLVNSPPNLLNPETFAQAIRELFTDVPGLSVDVWDEARLQKENMGLLLGVGQGSENKPRLVHLRYRPEGKKEAPLALVGKGITFDCGGLDLKDPAGMRLMKKDMGGAAAAVGALYWMSRSDFARPLDVYIPLAENAVSGRSYRPGDILRARNGMTVEIHNTDAEGRLVLADALAVAASQSGADKPAAIMVVATLTGAIKIGLGSDVAGFFTTDEALGQVISQRAQEWGDLMWRMPLFDGYRSRLETNVADINHCATGSYGGAITAALFLAEFAKGYPFSHMDIYAWTDGERGALREAGGSGQAVQCLAGVLQSFGL